MSNYETQAELDDATCLLLGQFVMFFSGLIHSIEHAIELLNNNVSAKDQFKLKALISKLTAKPMVERFYSAFSIRWGNELTEKDREILDCVKSELETLVDQRNRLMHDVWVNKIVGGAENTPQYMARHRTVFKDTYLSYEMIDYSPETISNLILDTKRLILVVNRMYRYSRPGMVGPELSPRIKKLAGKVNTE